MAVAKRKESLEFENGVVEKIPLDETIVDVGSNVNLTKGVYVVRATGVYDISAQASWEIGTLGGGEGQVLVFIYVNKSAAPRLWGVRTYATISGSAPGSTVVGMLKLKTGDEVELYGYCYHPSSSGKRKMDAGPEELCRMSIKRVA